LIFIFKYFKGYFCKLQKPFTYHFDNFPTM
jgi:hypothetical protein